MALAAVLCLVGLAHAEVRLGSEVLAAGGFRELRGKRVGLLTNPSGINRRGESTIDLLRSAPGVQLVALFAPEHGLYGLVKAGDRVEDGIDTRTGLPVHSLYGATRRPRPEMLKRLDALVYDLQDTGTRSYTYISTMGLAMEACADAGIEFVVLDRPNPLGGVRVEGPRLEDKFRSFIGMYDVPYVYGLTCGEVARMINGERWLKKPVRLTVIPLQGWRRNMTWADTRLPWVATSPNIPNLASVFGYPALGLIGEAAGGSGLSIGGVYRRPFQCVGAPWLEAGAFARELNRAGLPGIEFLPVTWNQDGRPHRVVDVLVKDPVNAPLVALNVHILDSVRRVTGRNLIREAEEAGRSLAMLDKAAGTDLLRRQLRAGVAASEIVRQWRSGEEEFRRQRRPYLLYPDVPVAATGRSPVPSPARPTSPAASRPGSYVEVTVKRGDTAYGIARDFGVTVNEIVEANPGLRADHLNVGQKLRVPQR
jgi:uncharacterized protein YbbC (DUF1343 family)